MRNLVNSDDSFDKVMNYIILILGIAIVLSVLGWAIWFKYHEDSNLEWALLGSLSFMCLIHNSCSSDTNDYES